jgi:hypothetical protein
MLFPEHFGADRVWAAIGSISPDPSVRRRHASADCRPAASRTGRLPWVKRGGPEAADRPVVVGRSPNPLARTNRNRRGLLAGILVEIGALLWFPHGAWERFWGIIANVVQALAIALVVRTLLSQPFNIPSGSLVPTLLIGDYLFVSKYAYGYSKHSIPFSPPIFSGRILSSEPKRGDIAVFKLPKDGSKRGGRWLTLKSDALRFARRHPQPRARAGRDARDRIRP